MKKIYLTLGLAIAFIGMNAQQFKAIPGKQVYMPNLGRVAQTYSITTTIDTLMPASVMAGGCVSSTVSTVGGLYNYLAGSSDSGYIFGTGIINIGSGMSTTTQMVAQGYSVSTTGTITVTDVLVLAGVAHGGTVTTVASIYSSASHLPNTIMGSSSTPLPMSSYSVSPNFTAFHFPTPVSVSTGSVAAGTLIWASVTVPATFGGADKDTLSILSTQLGGCSSGDSLSALYLGSPINSWFTVKGGFGQDGDLMIFPVMDIKTGSAAGIESYVSKNGLSLYAAYPNPANSSININFSLDKSADKVDINIYDVTGKIVKTITNSNVSIGKNLIGVDISNLEAGSYMYSLNANGTKMFSKFMVTK